MHEQVLALESRFFRPPETAASRPKNGSKVIIAVCGQDLRKISPFGRNDTVYRGVFVYSVDDFFSVNAIRSWNFNRASGMQRKKDLKRRSHET